MATGYANLRNELASAANGRKTLISAATQAGSSRARTPPRSLLKIFNTNGPRVSLS
jgi:hypothetical protein